MDSINKTRRTRPRYTPLRSIGAEEPTPLITQGYARRISLPWFALTTVLAILLTAASTRLWFLEYGRYPGNYIHDTDYAPVVPYIEYIQQRFTSGVFFDANGDPALSNHKDVPAYVGPPSPDIDKAWHDLISPEYFFAPIDEAMPYLESDRRGEYYSSVNGYLDVELDVFHSLHCLNMLRKALDKQYYFPDHAYDTRKNHTQFHWDHCIDQLRQNIMCHGDTTLNAAIYYPSVKAAFVDTEAIHTCRNFSKLREWASQRSRVR